MNACLAQIRILFLLYLSANPLLRDGIVLSQSLAQSSPVQDNLSLGVTYLLPVLLELVFQQQTTIHVSMLVPVSALFLF